MRAPLPGSTLPELLGVHVRKITNLVHLCYLRNKLCYMAHGIEEAELSGQKVRKAVAYLRTSSRTNVGADKDSDKRQRAAIEAYAKAAGYEVVDTFYDAAVSGADPVSECSGFAEMLERLMSNGAKTIIVESPDRFARDLMVQLAGHDMLKARGVTLIAASAPMHFVEDTPTAVLVRQVLGAVAEFEKTTLVAKLAAARRRKRMATGEKVEGRKSHAEARPDVVKLAKALARKKPKGGKLSLRAIAAEMAARGILSERGKPFNPKSVSVLLASCGASTGCSDSVRGG
jgi:DNA invertase Pin-like site-specific DNA recombinase